MHMVKKKKNKPNRPTLKGKPFLCQRQLLIPVLCMYCAMYNSIWINKHIHEYIELFKTEPHYKCHSVHCYFHLTYLKKLFHISTQIYLPHSTSPYQSSFNVPVSGNEGCFLLFTIINNDINCCLVHVLPVEKIQK